MRNIFRDLINLFFFRKKGDISFSIIGVGPGDPSLLTISAVRALKSSNIIFYPISREDKVSYSAEIVKKYIKFKKQIPIVFPMGRKEFNAEEIWNNAAKQIISYLDKNYSVSLLCLGDTSIYASSSYVAKQLKTFKPQIPIQVIPGISSISLAAALGDFQLINHQETLEILECPNNPNELSNLINNKNKRVLAIMKVGKRWKWVKEVLKKEKIFDEVLLATNVGMKKQFIGKASNNCSEVLPYFSLILVRL